MRACSFYRIHNFLYIITPESPYCERYFRSYLKYELAPPDAKAERLFKKKKRLISKIAVTYIKISRLRKQHRAVMKKLRDLDSRENRNILELEINKMLSDRQLFTLKILNSPSSRPFSFTIPVEKEFTNPFLRLLDSFGRNTEIP
jgi:tRNA(Ile)-lysidine synthase TilS/MesJ